MPREGRDCSFSWVSSHIFKAQTTASTILLIKLAVNSLFICHWGFCPYVRVRDVNNSESVCESSLKKSQN